ncbi:hypothetical protein DLJ53_26425 [Acuticoccus sediminis]|uniref:Nucleotide-diphospho-sugar transferase n=1 Tax=Acuticoccus sediminis TaxID=2184697 RepID=A0A8B2NN08_9HYPH|nr:hypothetical protein [Acuticoccus sediminis]RAH98248.1 hypothetical protein DLJ53_26425 [Acuticoccus sediminis]
MFIYSAFDRPDAPPVYTAEALVSARSLRRYTDKPIRLLTSRPDLVEALARRPDFPFTDIVPLEGDELPKAFKIRSIGTMAGSDCIFLDTDTVIYDDISRVFEFGAFDIAGVHMPYHREEIVTMADAVDKESRRYYALNSGVLFIRGAFAGPISEAWGESFARAAARHGPQIMDQPQLVNALLKLKPDLWPLSQNYNYRLMYGGVVSGTIFVVHTHYRRDVARIIKADFDTGMMDRLIERIGFINASVEKVTLPPVSMQTVPRHKLSRHRPRSGLAWALGPIRRRLGATG